MGYRNNAPSKMHCRSESLLHICLSAAPACTHNGGRGCAGPHPQQLTNVQALNTSRASFEPGGAGGGGGTQILCTKNGPTRFSLL